KIRAVDNAGNMSAGVDTAPWTVAGALIAVINNAPGDPSKDTVLDVTISGTNISEYRFKLGVEASTDCTVGAGYSAAEDVSEKIDNDFSGLADGDITLCVVGGNGTDWQAFADATEYTWEKDTTPPTNISIAINSGDAYTNNTSVTLTLGADDVTEMYITDTAGCGSGGFYEAFNTSKAWNLAQTNGTATVYVKFKDGLDNETACISDTIVHDNQNPNDPSGLTLGSVPPSLTTSPTISFIDENDNGPAGVQKFQVQFHKASDDSVIESWQDFVSGNSVTGLSLNDGEDYYA